MLINVDAKALEWVVCAHLSKDPVAIKEICDNIDQHTENQKMLGLPEGKEGRLIAKIFVFRLIYGSVAQGFAQDPDFVGISREEVFWEALIRKFYRKYQGIELYHKALVKEHTTTGKILMPTGREYYVPMDRGIQYARPKILNYPVQGLGHDLMTIARVSLYKKLMPQKLVSKLISTIHDSIIVDAVEKEKDIVITAIKETWDQIPHNYRYLTGDTTWTLPMRCEISVGMDLKNMETI